jgi:hypothetical protein
VGAVQAQIEAFQRGDFDAAYALNSIGLRSVWERRSWERMVRTAYPEIAAPLDVRVLDTFERPEGWYSLLRVVGRNGRIVDAVYKLIREDGAWKVDAVVTEPADLI